MDDAKTFTLKGVKITVAVLKKEEFFERLKGRVGDDSSDDAINFLEDMTDTYNDLEQKSMNNNNEDWEKKYRENDAAWKKRYTNRFFNGSPSYNTDREIDEKEDEYDPNSVTIDKLFEGGK